MNNLELFPVRLTNMAISTCTYSLIALCDNASLSASDATSANLPNWIENFSNFLRMNGGQIPFQLSAHSLADINRKIDIVSPSKFGFGYPSLLQDECGFLVPEPLSEMATPEELLRPIVTFRMNLFYMRCTMQFAALCFALIHRLIRFDARVAAASWDDLITVLGLAPIDNIAQATLCVTEEMLR